MVARAKNMNQQLHEVRAALRRFDYNDISQASRREKVELFTAVCEFMGVSGVTPPSRFLLAGKDSTYYVGSRVMALGKEASSYPIDFVHETTHVAKAFAPMKTGCNRLGGNALKRAEVTNEEAVAVMNSFIVTGAGLRAIESWLAFWRTGLDKAASADNGQQESWRYFGYVTGIVATRSLFSASERRKIGVVREGMGITSLSDSMAFVDSLIKPRFRKILECEKEKMNGKAGQDWRAFYAERRG